MNIYFRHIKKMAEAYRSHHPLVTIRQAVHEASMSYDLYKEAEAEIILSDMYDER